MQETDHRPHADERRSSASAQDDDVLTVEEVATWLRQSPSWVRAHAGKRRQPHMPGMKQGKCWRFRRGAVRDWMRKLEQEHGRNVA